ncbi:MAG: ubiquinone/menaquinone biosynthesis methyltransferase [Candidatus Rokubacteria bacterium]|nr:ubiquinone/menaquinone biosynthesis methyltransferase [Candidatus Rokubacteria bacterium]
MGPRSADVSAMFSRIARHYDLMNALMTGGLDRAWRRATARTAVSGTPPGPVLDLATGTADVALAIRRADPRRAVIGADFSEGMLHAGAVKLRRRGERRVALLAADALALPFADASFAAVTSAFLLRNLEDPGRGLREMRRVTMPGGRVVALEITPPPDGAWARLFGLYFHRVVPAVGALVAGDRAAYTYLPDSVAAFLRPDALAELMRAAGLRDVTYTRFGLGTIAIHTGVV